MGRAPCCEKVGLKKGRWTAEEDEILLNYIKENGEGSWRSLPKNAGLLRCGKSCRLRWINYLRTDLKKGNISPEEEELIIKLHANLGNRWSLIAGHLPGRTDNEIKNHWNSHLSRRIDTFWKFGYRRPMSVHHDKVRTVSYPKRRIGRTSRASMRKKTCLEQYPKSITKSTSSQSMASVITDQEGLTNGGALTLEENELESEIMSWLEIIQHSDDQDLGTSNNVKDDETANTNVIETKVDENTSCSNEQKMKEGVNVIEGGEDEDDWFLGLLDNDNDDGSRRWVDLVDEGTPSLLESNYIWDSNVNKDLISNCWDEHENRHDLIIDQTQPMESLEDWLFSGIF